MLSVTEAAQDVIKRLLVDNDRVDGGLRVGVTTGGCAGYQYSMAVEEQPTPEDMVIEGEGIRLYLDPDSAPLLDGTTLDYVESIEASGFNFINPNAEGKCSCGKSFSA